MLTNFQIYHWCEVVVVEQIFSKFIRPFFLFSFQNNVQILLSLRASNYVVPGYIYVHNFISQHWIGDTQWDQGVSCAIYLSFPTGKGRSASILTGSGVAISPKRVLTALHERLGELELWKHASGNSYQIWDQFEIIHWGSMLAAILRTVT